MKLDTEEKQLIERLLSIIAIKSRTGEIGVVHGADRFVSSQLILKKADFQKLESGIKKMGISPKMKKL
ncbi:hypothetical protein [Spongiimicrobium salis]|uniref:hypothetical protein n=1 Tax=Spongiimicrobium salis TaxID=1667022 RepID=UPI00374CD7D8